MITQYPPITRQLVLALDACEWDLVRKWSDAGKLPTFRRLFSEGTFGRLSTPGAQVPDAVWSCLYSGRNPAAAEKYFYIQYDPTTGDLQHVRVEGFTKRPFWDVLSERGRRVGVVDIIKYPTSENLNGFQLTNWGDHASSAARTSVPRELYAEIEKRFGRHPVGDCDKSDHDPRSQLKLRNNILAGVAKRGEVLRALMREQQWDVFIAGFSEMHCVGHHFWHWQDDMHPHFGEPDELGLADSMERVYRAVDTELGKILAQLDGNTRAFVVASHGMGPLYHASWNLPEILGMLGFGREPAHAARPAKKASVNPWRILRMILPGKLQYFIRDHLPYRLQDELLFRWYAGARDWKGHRAFAVPNNDSVGAIRINLKGRDRHGIVNPSEYDSLCDAITEAMLELEDPVTGKKVVNTITRCHTVFHGEYQDLLPDLTIYWEQSFPWRALRSPRFGTISLASQDARSGSHTNHGFFFATGPGIAAGVELKDHSIYDIAPTVLEGAQVPVPENMEGRALLQSSAGAAR